MSTRFFTNHGVQTLFSKFEGVFASNKDLAAFDALVGYLRSSGWFAVRPFLDHVPQIRVLVGINVDSLVADYQKRGLLFHGAEGETLTQLKSNLLKDIEEAEYSSHVETGILQFIEDVSSKRIQIRAHPTKNLHAKIYIFRPQGFNEHRPGAVISDVSHSLSWVLNPHSHSRPVDHIRREIQQAVDVVTSLEIEVNKDIVTKREVATKKAAAAEAKARLKLPPP